MSKLSKNEKYLKLENVRVSYQHKTNTIHITSDDQDLKNSPFKLTLNNNTEAYKNLKDLLTEKGLIHTQDDKNSIPKSVCAVIDSRSPWGEIPIGVTKDEILYWSVKDYHNLTIDSATVGCGASSVRNSILSHCVSHNNKWEVYLHDFTKGDLQDFKKYSNTVKKFSNTMIDLFYTVSALHSEMKTRLELLEGIRVPNVSFLTKPPKNILLFIEGFKLLEMMKHPSETSDDLEKLLIKETFSKLEEISNKGHKASIHIAQSGVGLSKVADLNIMQNFTNTILLGHYTDEDFTLIVDAPNDKLESPPKGRGLFYQLRRATEIQIYSLPVSDIEKWILEFGPKNEPELFKSLLLSSIITDSNFK